MAYVRIMKLELVCLLSAGVAGCEAGASEAYLGEPLLQLHGQAIVAAETGGEAVTPALCFNKAAPFLLPDSFDKLPAELREELAPFFDVGRELKALAGRAGQWTPNQRVEIVEVESVGRFPAEFNVEAYLPPSDAFIQPAFEGEPPLAEGYLCAVREGHPDVVTRPYLALTKHCENDNAGPCTERSIWASYDSDAYYIQTFHCPGPDSPHSECEATTEGDVAVLRNLRGSYIEANAQPILVYLAAPAAAGSYTAWKYGSAEGLSAGFHLFEYADAQQQQEYQRQSSDSCRSAQTDARAQIREEYAERVHTFDAAGVPVDNLEDDPVLKNALGKRSAELQMDNCALPLIHPVSHTQSLMLHFLRPKPQNTQSAASF